ncbi:MAG: hypothetical protein PHR26_03485 [Candidatus ainarchaeum sp.]|nr:hypothetical protein [Candidatus ainarchaeum sp.]MDD3976432.1 hypothetical protein [Candidatus ainarchaeum sp.]
MDKCKYIVAWGVPELLSKLKKYKRTIAIYENISSKTFEQIMDNKYITEVYIFSHGQRFGVGLSDKFYRYKNLLKITPKIKKNIICQLHCGGRRKMKSTDISLESFAKKCKIHNRDVLLFENCFWILFKFDKFYNK